MPDHKPSVSVIVPAYNAACHLHACLESLQAQTFGSFEALIIDDGSTDHTCAVAERFAKTDKRFRLIRQPNAGVGAARNMGIGNALGRYIAPLDADDVWLPKKLEVQMGLMEPGDPAVGLVYCWSHRIDSSGRFMGFSHPYQAEGDIRHLLVMRHFIGNASVPLIRTAALQNVGLYLTSSEQGGAQGCEDWDLHLRIAERFQVRFVPEYLVGYRQATRCMSSDALSMAKSYRTVMARARARNSDLPPRLFSWSSGSFYWYLARKCHRCRNDRGALWSLTHAVATDPSLLANPQLYRILVRSTAHWLTRGKLRRLSNRVPAGQTVTRPAPPASPRMTLYQQVQARRWSHAVNTVGLNPLRSDQGCSALSSGIHEIHT